MEGRPVLTMDAMLAVAVAATPPGVAAVKEQEPSLKDWEGLEAL